MTTPLELEYRLDCLERRNQRLQKWVIGLIGCLAVVLLTSYGCSKSTDPAPVTSSVAPPNNIVAKQITVVDDDGNEIITIGQLPEKGVASVGLRVSTKGGMLQVAIKENGLAGLSARSGTSIAALVTDSEASSLLLKCEGHEVTGVCDEEHSNLAVREGKAAVELDSNSYRSVVQTADVRGVTRASFGVLSFPGGWTGPDMHFFDADFVPIANLAQIFPQLEKDLRPKN